MTTSLKTRPVLRVHLTSVEWSESWFRCGAASRVVQAAERRAALSRSLLELQRGDGAVVGASAAMKEDDPLVATALAVAAWARIGD